MTRQIITRFAPSPTGYLHIGGARTALFNWLYAHGVHGADKGAGAGKFLLRIEDTDRARHNEAAVEAILDGLSWLGLDWDGEPVSQYARAARHREVAESLLEKGLAYRCWLAGDELTAARDAARAENRRFESPWRDHDGPTPDEPYVIRFKAPKTGETEVKDLIQGDVTFAAEALDDLVLLRSDGSPTYMLAVVVDDHDMEISHIIRGDDHFVNAARQQQVYEALGWEVPQFAHMPLIHGSDGKKLSKRHGALGVEAYRDEGYLPEGVMNYLLRLGWSHGDDEIIPADKAKEWFDVKDINKAPSRLDLDKLAFVNSHYIRDMADEAFIDAAMSFLPPEFEPHEQALLRSAPFLKERSKTLKEVIDSAAFINLKRPIELAGKSAKPLKKEGAADILADVVTRLTSSEDWTEETLDGVVQSIVDEKAVGFGQVGQPVRAALTAGHPSPSLGQVMYSLGKEETLGRLQDQIKALQAG
jgi:glutamyl-tRNA synthetase